MDSPPSLLLPGEGSAPAAPHRQRRRPKGLPSLSKQQAAGEYAQLTFSDFTRPTIVLGAAETADSATPRPAKVELAWWPNPISSVAMARLVDGLIVLTAVLVFLFLSISSTSVVPSWPIAAALAAGVSLVFAVGYRILFRTCARGTPGQYLAQLATGRDADAEKQETRSRFR